MKVVFITKQGWLILIAVVVFIVGNCILLHRVINKTTLTDNNFREIADRFLPRGRQHSNLYLVAAAVNELQRNRPRTRLGKPAESIFNVRTLPKDERDEEKRRVKAWDNLAAKIDDKKGIALKTGISQLQVKSAANAALPRSEVVAKVVESTKGTNSFVAAVLVIACNRPTVKRCLDLLLKYRPSPEQFPIVVSQDCGHGETAAVIRSYGSQVTFIQQPDLSNVQGVPRGMQQFMGYYKISRHYKWALGQTFDTLAYDTVLIVEDDLDIAPDFFEYFTATKPLLDKDPTLWCISAWNDNGKEGMVERNDILYRSDFFPGLGWMIRKPLWVELKSKWPLGFWDDWMREPAQRKDRACIRPEISRTRTFGKVGVSHGQFFDQHLKYIKLNDQIHPFTKTDLSYLLKDNYDKNFVGHVHALPLVTAEQIRQQKVFAPEVQIHYSSDKEFDHIAKLLGAMSDFKAGVPRMAYKGMVTIIFKGVRVHIAPSH